MHFLHANPLHSFSSVTIFLHKTGRPVSFCGFPCVTNSLCFKRSCLLQCLCSIADISVPIIYKSPCHIDVVMLWFAITSVVHINRTRSPTPIICWIENFGGFWLFVCMLQACWQLREISDSWWTHDSEASPAVLFRPTYNWFLSCSCSSNLNWLDALKKERTDNGEWCTISTMRHAAVKIV